MPNHQHRRAPLPADYQFPTHGVDCDCPPCRNEVVQLGAIYGVVDPRTGATLCNRCERSGPLALGMCASCRRAVGVHPQTLEPTAETPWGV